MPVTLVVPNDQLPARIPIHSPVQLRGGGHGVLVRREHGRRLPVEVVFGDERVALSEDDLMLDVRAPHELAQHTGVLGTDALPTLVRMLGRSLMGPPSFKGPAVPPHFVDGGALMPTLRYDHSIEVWCLQLLGYGWCFSGDAAQMVYELSDPDHVIHVPDLAELETQNVKDIDIRRAAVLITLSKPWTQTIDLGVPYGTD